MNKKIIIAILLFFLCACTNKKQETPEIKYIEPTNNINIFDEFDNNSRAILKLANGNSEVSNYQFKMIGKDIYENNLVDINGNTINFNDYDKFIIEFVSTGCSHCRKMISEHLDAMLNTGIKLIQYYTSGDSDDIKTMYDEIGIQIPEGLIICCNDKGFNEYAKSILRIELFPTLIAYGDGKVLFDVTGELNSLELQTFYDVSYKKLVDFSAYSETIWMCRGINDVESDLSKESIERLKSINDNDDAYSYTLKIMGTKLDFDNIKQSSEDIYINEIEDYSEYKNSNLVLIYTYINDPSEIEKVRFINSIIDSNEELKYIVVLIEGMDSSSNSYSLMNEKFHCPCVSSLSSVPRDFTKFGIRNYPTFVFVEKSTFTGVVSGVNEIDKFSQAVYAFIGENCIARLSNN